MTKSTFLLLALLALDTPAFATWSVIAVDRGTGRVVISSSTCTGNTDDFLKDVQAVVVPGKGVAAFVHEAGHHLADGGEAFGLQRLFLGSLQ